MNNDLTNKEQEFKEAADAMSFDLNIDDLWEGVESQLPPIEKSRRRAIWWMTGSLLLAIILVGSLMLFSEKHDLKAAPAELLTDKTITSDDLALTKDTSISDESEADIKNQESKLNIISKSELITIDNHVTIPKTNTIDISKNNISSLNRKNINLDTPANINYLPNTTTNNEASKLTMSNQYESTLEKLIATSNSHEITKLNEIDNPERSLLAIQMNTPRVPNTRLESSVTYDLNSPAIKPLKSTLWKPYWMVAAGVNFHQEALDISSAETQDLAQFSKETTLPGASVHVSYGMESSSGWRSSIGMSYDRLVSRYNNNQITESTVAIDGVKSSTIDVNGNEINNTGQLNQTTITEYAIKWHRNHDFINLNLGIGKELMSQGNISVFADFSAGYNIYSRHTGYSFEEGSDEITKFSNSDTHAYQNQGINFGGSLTLEYRVRNYSIALSPFYKQSLGAMTQESNYYQIKNSQYGIQLGVVYRP